MADRTPCIAQERGHRTALPRRDVRPGSAHLAHDLLIPDVRIEQGRTTDIVVPTYRGAEHPAATPGPGAIFEKKDDQLVWVADLDPTAAMDPIPIATRQLPGHLPKPQRTPHRILHHEGRHHRKWPIHHRQFLSHDHEPFPILDQKDTRSGFGAGLHELGKKQPRTSSPCAPTSPVR